MKVKNLLGERFGKLTVILRGVNTKANKATWICKCDCGSDPKSIVSNHLINGRIRSCGCMLTTHGLSRIYPLAYKSWKNMRCRVRSRPSYADIKVCDRWQDFSLFIEDAVKPFFIGDRPAWATLDRIKPLDNYEPNCIQWLPLLENNKKKRTTKYLTIYGETKTVWDWSRDSRCRLSAQTLLSRIYSGVEVNESILTTKYHWGGYNKSNVLI